MGLETKLFIYLLCIAVVLVNSNVIDFLQELPMDTTKGMQKDNGEMMYCYQSRNKQRNGQNVATDHIRDHFFGEMTHSNFITTAQLRLKELTGNAQFVLLSVGRTNIRKSLFIWWINIKRKQVGITYTGVGGLTTLQYFSRVPFPKATWFKLTLRFRGFQKKKPTMELYLNENKLGEQNLRKNFRNAILKANKNDIKISMADMYGLTRTLSMPKLCMRGLKLYSDTDTEDVIRQCPKTEFTKSDLDQLEQRIIDKVKESYTQTISKVMQQLNTCGVCKKAPPPIAVKPPVVVVKPPPTKTKPIVVKPVPKETKPKEVLKSLVAKDPCPPGLNSCHPKATCTPNVLASGNTCKCNLGFAGNGYSCGTDSDLDGFPDEDVPNCKEKHCKKDNCIYKPNSGQENADGDALGNACDDDKDNDGIMNKEDNCELHYNPSQQDSDGDKIGDACDNCIKTRNRKQKDTDSDGKGDACTDDIDSDGIIENDNCPYVKNNDQKDTDKDGVGDACDNCVNVKNSGQEDVDNDLVGDKCDSNIDRDVDGVNDEYDNCINVVNPGQLDTDGDGMGDDCDPDDDNDGVLDEKDNCRLTPNKDQKVDPTSPKYGIACKDDYDGDSILNNDDICPENKDYSSVTFYEYQTINLDPKEEEQIDPVWKVLDEGKEIFQVENSDPGMAIGKQYFGGVDYYGTIYVDTEQDNDYFGLIFGFQSSSKFYTVMWKKVGQTYWDKEPFEAVGKTGLSIKVVNSITGPGPELRNALWNTDSTKNQVRTIWHDPNEIGWSERTAYHWDLRHRPKTGHIRFKIFDGKKTVIDTGVLHDKTYSGGRIGVMSFSQEKVSWSKIFYRCNGGSVKK